MKEEKKVVEVSDRTASTITKGELETLNKALVEANYKITKSSNLKFATLHESTKLIADKLQYMQETDIDALVTVVSEDAKVIEKEVRAIYADKKVNLADVKNIFDVAVTLKRIFNKLAEMKQEIKTLTKKKIKLLLATVINNI